MSDLAVILIDMQEEFVDRLSKKDKKIIILAQQKLLHYCQEKQLPLVVLEYRNNTEEYGSTIAPLANIIADIPGVIKIDKPANDGFEKTELLSKLQLMQVKRLWLAGINASACVYDTAESALEHFSIATSNDLIADPAKYEQHGKSRRWYEQHGQWVSYAETLMRAELPRLRLIPSPSALPLPSLYTPPRNI